MKIEIVPSLLDIPWSIEHFGANPFSSAKFYRLFEEAQVVGPETGWNPIYFLAIEEDRIQALLPAYIKTDSFGEFIFDWAWADLYKRVGIEYYPKLVAAIPFSPVNAPKVLFTSQQAKDKLLEAFAGFLQDNASLSSAHALFTTKSEARRLEREGFFTRITIQYHLELDYRNFDEYLASLKARKRKQIKKERAAVAAEKKLCIQILEDNFSDDLMDEVYELYLGTIEKKWSQAYLNKDFFRLLAKDWSKSLVIAVARDERGLAAMSLFLKTDDALYGRYWGARSDVDVPYLHFELSYYQGIDYCLKRGIKLFEAGAQGEQKLLRGFRPVEILSSHKLSNEPLSEAVERHVKMENAYTKNQIKELERHLPFRLDSEKTWQDS